jgi:hypothetical protein
MSSFSQVREIMTAPLSEEEIEQFYQQEPLNQAPQLPAEEEQPTDPNQLCLF